MNRLIVGFADELFKLAAAPGTLVKIPKQPMWSPPKAPQSTWQPSPTYTPKAPAAKPNPVGGRGRAGAKGVPKGYTAPTLGFSKGRAYTPVSEKPPLPRVRPSAIPARVLAKPVIRRAPNRFARNLTVPTDTSGNPMIF